jgi:Secretion system C-terminal sorting domain
MRFYLLILINFLCLTTGYNQAVQTIKRINIRSNSLHESFKPQSIEITSYDKDNCLDTLIFTGHYNADGKTFFNGGSKIQKKYDTQKRLIEKVESAKNFYLDDKTKDTIWAPYKTRIRYIYTPSNVKADTSIYDAYDYNRNSWSKSQLSVIRKGGFGLDTVKSYYSNFPNDSSYSVTVYDNKARAISGEYITDGDTTYKYYVSYDAADRLISQAVYSVLYKLVGKTPLSLSYYEFNTYVDNKITQKYFKDSYGTTDTTIQTTNYYYKSDLKDYEETTFKRIYPRLNNLIDTGAYRLQYIEYNKAGKCLEQAHQSFDTKSNQWVNTGSAKFEYQNDTLLIKSTATGSHGEQSQYIYKYGLCGFDVSNPNNNAINFTVAPNPASNNLTVAVADEDFSDTNAQFSILDLQGKIILNKKMTTLYETIDVSNFARGFYMVQIRQNDRFSVKKVVLY